MRLIYTIFQIGSNNKKKVYGSFGLCNRLAEGSESCFKDQVEWCLCSPTEP